MWTPVRHMLRAHNRDVVLPPASGSGSIPISSPLFIRGIEYIAHRLFTVESSRPKFEGISHIGRGPRVPFTHYQIYVMEQKYHRNRYLSSGVFSELAALLQIPESRVWTLSAA